MTRRKQAEEEGIIDIFSSRNDDTNHHVGHDGNGDQEVWAWEQEYPDEDDVKDFFPGLDLEESDSEDED